MAQHDYNIINGPGAAVRKDINDALAAIVSCNAGPLAPSVALPGTLWFDISVAPGKLKILGLDGNWHKISAGAVYLPLVGGNIIGDLTVTGVFSNPDFTLRRKNYVGSTAPATKVPGQIWYDTSVTPNSLKIWSGSAWVELVDVTSPTFTQMITIDGPTYAILNLVAGGENRRVYSDSINDRMVFDSIPGGGAKMLVSDAGDWWTTSTGWLSTAFANKQANLGFTPIQQYDASQITIGSNPAHLWVNNVDQGVIRLGENVQTFTVGQVGCYCRCTSVDPTIPGNSTVAGGNLRIGRDSSNMYGTGTWRNMGGRVTDAGMALFQRIA